MYLIALLLVVFSGSSGKDDAETERFRLMPSSHVIINGKSNINSFSCTYSFSDNSDNNIFKTSSSKAHYVLDSVSVKIPVEAFDCGNRLLKKDFMNTLEHENQPDIFMQMQSLDFSKYSAKNIHSEVLLEIGGVARNQQISYRLNKIDDNVFVIEGNTLVDITDFELEPASRFFGMIKVDKQVEIRFLFNFVKQQ